jgi:NodT family efflux transporter outer membrane factor (OMF) lipoprotein
LKNFWRGLSVAALTATLAGCAVGPDFRTPSPPEATRYTETPLPAETVGAPVTGGTPQRFVSGAKVADEWWTLYQSEPLNALIRAGIADSPTLSAAQATLVQVRETYAAREGALLYPGIDANASASRQKVAAATSSGAGGGGTIFNLYNASVSVGYMLDFFGRNRRELEGLAARVDYSGYQLDAAYLALTSNIVTTAVREASLRAQIAAVHDILANEERALQLTEKQRQLGGIGRLPVLTQGAQVAQTRALLPPLERELAQTRHLLAVLIGRFPSDAALPVIDLESLTLPVDLPVSLPSELVRQRPDIRAAEALMHQASALIGVATANLYPQITLSGSFGVGSTSFRDFLGGPSAWSIGAALLQPLFHGGQLQAERRAAIAAYDAAAAQYHETVLQAFQNVADALKALEDDARLLKAQADAERLARESLELTQRQYQIGAVSFLTLLVVQRQYNQARLALVQVQGNRYANVAALFQALGGGWWNRESGSGIAKTVSAQ